MLPLASEAQESLRTLGDVLVEVAGQEVSVEGSIGTGLDMMDSEALFFRSNEETVFPVVFDAGREVRRQLEGCRFAMFGGGTPCRMSGKAELEWSGSQLRLIIFDVESIEAPTKED
jgi:hypothetical protein